MGAALLATAAVALLDPSNPLPALWTLLPEPVSYNEPSHFGGLHPDDPEAEQKRRQAVGTNGLVVDSAARVGRWWGEDAIIATWTMRYIGPRAPLIVERPSFGVSSNTEATVMSFGVKSRAGEHYYHWFQPPLPGLAANRFAPGRWSTPDDFVRVPAGRTTSGVLVAKVAWLRDDLCRLLPKQFTPDRPPVETRLYLRLHPLDRGEAHNLDAWTGTVETNEVTIPLRKW